MIAKFILLLAVACSQAVQIHHNMTDDEIYRIFKTKRHAVPEYEIHPIAHQRHLRSASEEQIVRLGKRELNFRPNDGVLYGWNTPVIQAVPDRSKPFGVRFVKVANPWKGVGTPYHDRKTRSAVIIHKDLDDSVQMTGRIMDDYVVHPVPHRLNDLVENTQSADETDDDFKQGPHHFVFKQPLSTEDKKALGLLAPEDASENGSQSRLRRAKADEVEVPEVVYPEILVTMDHTLYATQDKDMTKALAYLLAFWNLVDLRFRSMTAPKIQLNIAGFVISTEQGGTPFFRGHGRGMVEVDEAIGEMRDFFYPDGRIPAKYDISIAMTQWDLYTPKPNGTSVVGYATLRGSCLVDHGKKKTYGVGLIEDNGMYKAILTAAHELGHLLGASHDGEAECPGNSGNLMGAVGVNAESQWYWSPCTMSLIQKMIKTRGLGECLFNAPRPGKPLSTVLPGKLLSLDDQCQRLTGANADPDSVHLSCNNLICKKITETPTRISWLVMTKPPAVEGSYCGDYKHCIAGRCVPSNDRSRSATTRKPTTTTPKPRVRGEARPGVLTDQDGYIVDISEVAPGLARQIREMWAHGQAPTITRSRAN